MKLTPTDFIRVYEGARSRQWCYARYAELKACYGLTQPRHLPTLRQFCDYMALDVDDVKAQLGWVRQNQRATSTV